MSYICPECGSEHYKKPTYEDMIKKAIPASGIKIRQLYEMYGSIMTIATIDIIINRLLIKHDCYIPEKMYVASCYGDDGVRHIFPK